MSLKRALGISNEFGLVAGTICLQNSLYGYHRSQLPWLICTFQTDMLRYIICVSCKEKILLENRRNYFLTSQNPRRPLTMFGLAV